MTNEEMRTGFNLHAQARCAFVLCVAATLIAGLAFATSSRAQETPPDDFDDELESYQELRQTAVENAASAAATIAELYINSVGVLSQPADLVFTIGELADGEMGPVQAALNVVPFVSRPMVDAAGKVIVRTDTGQDIFRRGADIPGLDKRAIQGVDSAQHGLGLIPRKILYDYSYL